jgi:hypothetical protein
MIGKTVDGVFTHPITGEIEQVQGYVDAVTTKNNQVFLLVGGKEIPLDSVSIVGDDYLTALQLNDILDHVSNTRNQSYVGKWIQAITFGDDGQLTGYVEGNVDYIKIVSGKPVLMVGKNEVFPNEIVGITDKGPFLIGAAGIENGSLVDIMIKNNKAHLVFAGMSETVPIEQLNHLMDSLKHVGDTINNGTVKSILVQGGYPHFVIQNDDGTYQPYLSYLVFKGLI